MESFDDVRAALMPNLQLWEQTLSTPQTPIRLSLLVPKPHICGFCAQVVFESQEMAPNPLYNYNLDFVDDEGPVLILGMTFRHQKCLELVCRIDCDIQEFFETQAPKIAGVIQTLCPKAFEDEDCESPMLIQRYPDKSMIY